jgi:tetratricopeptide (TPR) repeat protein
VRQGPNLAEGVPLTTASSGALELPAGRGGAGRRRFCKRVCLGLTLALLVSAGVWICSAWLFEKTLAEARRLMDADRFSEARQSLLRVPWVWLKNPEWAYRLGVCEHAGGDFQAALAAWTIVDSRSSWAVPAGVARAKTLIGDLGRLSDAETILVELLRQPGPDRDQVRHALAELFYWQGRRDTIRRLLEQSWRNAADPVAELHDHWRLDGSPMLLDKIRAEVERASSLAPDDDRAWLARAHLAMQSGQFDDASSLLDRCIDRRPHDPDVWKARLEWSRAAGNLDEVRKSLSHLDANLFTEEQRLSLRAWLSARLGNKAAEQRALEQLVPIVHDSWAMDRLALLAWNAGLADRARDYRLRKAELDAAKDRYRQLMDQPLIPERFVELATLAESLGRRFEARGWWSLRARYAPSDHLALDALARLKQAAGPPRLSDQVKLADLFADIDPKLKTGPDRPRLEPPKPPACVPQFADDATRARLVFTFDNGRSPLRQIPETSAGGVGLLDYDGDGQLDVYVLQGGAFPPDHSRPGKGDRLFRNQGDGTFVDATERSGIAGMKRGFGHGVAIGDIDNDGRPDLFVTRWRSYALYHNRGDGSFEDITDRAGLGGDRDWPTSAAFADLDNDGDLDLYVCHYLVWNAEHPQLCRRETVTAERERIEPEQMYNYCTPRLFPALPDHLFRNDGGRFVDVTAEAGIVDQNGRGLGVVAADLDADGLIDLFVANDTTANYLWHNKGGMKFEEAGVSSGVACNADGAFQAGMGTACGDLDGDQLPDLFVTNFYGESTTFFRNLGSGIFGDQTAAIGLAAPSRFLLGFGIGLLDADNDGHLDLATANGHVNDDRPDFPYAMPATLMMGGKEGRLTDLTQAAGQPWTVPRVARGLAVGDLDNDGQTDIVIVSQQTPLAYFHNRTAGGHSVTFSLEGTKSNRDGVGAVVTVNAGGRVRRAWRHGGGSFLSASDPRLHFGLGQDRIGDVEVRWPSGHVDRFGPMEVDRHYRLRERDAQATSLRSFGRR